MSSANRSIKRAVIPVAGLGTRMGPITQSVPKCMFPLVDARRRLRPLLHHACMEASAAGIDNVAIVAGPRQTDLLHRYFNTASKDNVGELPVNIEFLSQPQPRGLGDALMQAEYYAAGEPLMMLLGDYAWRAGDQARCCAAQVADAFAERGGAAMVGMTVVGAEDLSRLGVARGRLLGDNVYACEDLIEKPSPAVAKQRLVSPDLQAGRYLAHGGIYVFTPAIFDCLRELSRGYRPGGEELQLTAAQQMLLKRRPGEYFLVRIEGRCIDCGSPAGYADAFAAVRGPAAPAPSNVEGPIS